MKAMVRDDIIALETFVALRFKYEKYAEMLNDAGGYCFVDQFVQHFGGNNKGRYLAQQLEDNGVIKTQFFNNYKYCYLTDAAIKYLKYKDDPRDFSNMKKADITVKKITPNPTDKVLFSSALKFGLMQKYKFIGKKSFIENITAKFKTIYESSPNKDEEIKKAINKTISYYDKSKIIFVIDMQKNSLQMLILDTGSKKSANSYIIILKDYLETVKIDFKSIMIVIVAMSENDTINLINALNEKIIERKAKEQSLRLKYPTEVPNPIVKSQDIFMSVLDRWSENQAASRKQNELEENQITLKNEMKKLDNEIPNFTVRKLSMCFYMEHYKDKVNSIATYIKPKDQTRFEALKQSMIKKV